MTTRIDRYVDEVMERIAPGIPGRARIAIDLRTHLAERIEADPDEGRAIERMGPAEEVARSFLAEIDPPLAEPGSRLGAFLFDAGLCLALLAATGALVAAVTGPGDLGPEPGWPFRITILVAAVAFIAPALLYFPVLEAWRGQTLGKRIFGTYVAKESGERAGLGATVVRRIPLLFEFWFVDALFLPFTEKRQRAFDIIARTIVVQGDRPVGPVAAWALALVPWLVVAGLGGLIALFA